MFTLRFITVQ